MARLNEGRTNRGDSVPLHVRLGGLEDGSLIFVVTEREQDQNDAVADTDTNSPRENVADESTDTETERD